MNRKHLMAVALVAVTAVGVPLPIAFGAQVARAQGSITLNLVAYSTPQEAYGLIIPAFAKTSAGKGVSVQASYGASGDQSRKVLQGLSADIVAVSLAPDITRLVPKIVKPSWKTQPYGGMVTDSVVVFGVRKGNPKHIKSWSDLLKKGVDVLTPNPFTSGGARWNVMAAFGAQIAQHRTKKQAIDYLTNLFANHVSVQDDSARNELQTFLSGKGDVMLAYENEMIGAQQAGQKVAYVVPPQSILIENPVAVTMTSGHPAQAQAFFKFLWSSTAQTIFGQKGYRPVVKSVAKKFHFVNPKSLFTIAAVGGWANVQKQFFDPSNGIMAGIERNKGH
jgi:sulfate/thiosulfate transport system substrate-binding protein